MRLSALISRLTASQVLPRRSRRDWRLMDVPRHSLLWRDRSYLPSVRTTPRPRLTPSLINNISGLCPHVGLFSQALVFLCIIIIIFYFSYLLLLNRSCTYIQCRHCCTSCMQNVNTYCPSEVSCNFEPRSNLTSDSDKLRLNDIRTDVIMYLIMYFKYYNYTLQ